MEPIVDQGKFGKRSPGMDLSHEQRQVLRLTDLIKDLKLCMTGNSASKRWKALQAELYNLEKELKFKRTLIQNPTDAQRAAGEAFGLY